MNYYERQAELGIVEQFCRSMENAHLSANTMDQRRRFLRSFVTNVGIGGDRAAIEAWLGKKKIKPKTLGCWISHLNAFYVWAIATDVVESNPTVDIPRPKVIRKPPRPLPEKELAYALKKANAHMKCLMLLGAFAGLRCGEIVMLDREDIIEDAWLHVPQTKANKERLVPMHPDVYDALLDMGLPETGPLFTRYDGSRSHGDDIAQQIGKFMQKNGVKFSAISLRHYFGAQTLKACHDVRVVQELMGHKYIGTTLNYARFDRQAGKQAVGSLSLLVD